MVGRVVNARVISIEAGRSLLYISLVALSLSGFLSGCQGIFARGPVPQTSRILLPQGERVVGHWEGRDLVLDYNMLRGGDSVDISGNIRFLPVLRNNFTMIRHFNASILFLDSQGRSLESKGLVVASYAQPTDDLPFKTTHTLPPGTEAVAFKYTGLATESGSDEGGAASSFFDGP